MVDLNDMIEKGNAAFLMALDTDREIFYVKAIEMYSRVVNIIPIAHILTNLGVSLDNIGDYEGAIIRYTESLESKNDNSRELKSMTYYNRGFVNHYLGNVDLAKIDYKKAIEFGPENYRPYHALGAINNDFECYIDAIKNYKTALKFCHNKDQIKSIKNNIKNSNKNMEYLLEAIGQDVINKLNYEKNLN